MQLDKQKTRMLLMSIATMTAPIAEMTATKIDDKVLEAIQKIAMNDPAMDLFNDLLILFTENEFVTENDIKLIAKQHS